MEGISLNCGGKLLVLRQPVCMGIVNTTPDSFFEGSRFEGVDAVVAQAEKMLNEGAALLDLGAQSSRPGASVVGAEEELRRLIPALEAVRLRFPDARLSVDTWHARVAKEAAEAGAVMINDISGGRLDPQMHATVAQNKLAYVCMHSKGTPDTMQNMAQYEDVVTEVLDYFIQQTEACRQAGILDVVIDPGFGFAKTAEHNFQLLKDLHVFHTLSRPILLGISRKSTIYKTLGITANEALNGSTVLHTLGLLSGVHILRVHDVKPAMEAIKLVEAYTKAGAQ